MKIVVSIAWMPQATSGEAFGSQTQIHLPSCPNQFSQAQKNSLSLQVHFRLNHACIFNALIMSNLLQYQFFRCYGQNEPTDMQCPQGTFCGCGYSAHSPCMTLQEPEECEGEPGDFFYFEDEQEDNCHDEHHRRR